MSEIAPGIVTVYDLSYEYDTYFDRSRWEPSCPQIWGDSLFPSGLEGTGIGVLPGVGLASQVRSFDEALEFAKRNLKSVVDSKMYDAPLEIDLDERIHKYLYGESK